MMQALYFQKYVDVSGIRPEQVAQIAINQRRNASLNPAAVYRQPITLDDYFNSPIITTPLRLYDCDVPVDGAAALILSRRDIAASLRNPPIRLEAIGSALHCWQPKLYHLPLNRCGRGLTSNQPTSISPNCTMAFHFSL
jgi:acetyl-CoA acetyltransferase